MVHLLQLLNMEYNTNNDPKTLDHMRDKSVDVHFVRVRSLLQRINWTSEGMYEQESNALHTHASPSLQKPKGHKTSCIGIDSPLFLLQPWLDCGAELHNFRYPDLHNINFPHQLCL